MHRINSYVIKIALDTRLWSCHLTETKRTSVRITMATSLCARKCAPVVLRLLRVPFWLSKFCTDHFSVSYRHVLKSQIIAAWLSLSTTKILIRCLHIQNIDHVDLNHSFTAKRLLHIIAMSGFYVLMPPDWVILTLFGVIILWQFSNGVHFMSEYCTALPKFTKQKKLEP